MSDKSLDRELQLLSFMHWDPLLFNPWKLCYIPLTTGAHSPHSPCSLSSVHSLSPCISLASLSLASPVLYGFLSLVDSALGHSLEFLSCLPEFLPSLSLWVLRLSGSLELPVTTGWSHAVTKLGNPRVLSTHGAAHKSAFHVVKTTSRQRNHLGKSRTGP